MARKITTLSVTRTERLSSHFVRVYLGGNGFDDFVPAGGPTRDEWDTDMYVKIIFAPDGVTYPEPLDMQRIRETLPPEQQPILRTYTVRSVDTDRREIAIDFVVHGDEGIAGPWAASVQPGETVRFLGPGSGYRPRSDAPWHLLAADEAGLPALAAAIEALPADAIGSAIIEVAGPADELPINAPTGLDVVWVHRGGAAGEVGDDRAGDNAPLIEAVRSAPWLDGEPQVFIHGEAQAVMHNLRAYVRKERGVGAANASISGYWRRGRTEESFRQWKAQLREREDAAGAPA